MGKTFNKLGKDLAYERKDKKEKIIERVGIIQTKDLKPGDMRKKYPNYDDPFATLRRN